MARRNLYILHTLSCAVLVMNLLLPRLLWGHVELKTNSHEF